MSEIMIEKVEVRRKLNAYKTVIRERMKAIHDEDEKMKNACSTMAMENVWSSSKEKAVLRAKYEVLNEVVQDIFDLLDDFEDNE